MAAIFIAAAKVAHEYIAANASHNRVTRIFPCLLRRRCAEECSQQQKDYYNMCENMFHNDYKTLKNDF
jgi:hypothetical protein